MYLVQISPKNPWICSYTDPRVFLFLAANVEVSFQVIFSPCFSPCTDFINISFCHCNHLLFRCRCGLYFRGLIYFTFMFTNSFNHTLIHAFSISFAFYFSTLRTVNKFVLNNCHSAFACSSVHEVIVPACAFSAINRFWSHGVTCFLEFVIMAFSNFPSA